MWPEILARPLSPEVGQPGSPSLREVQWTLGPSGVQALESQMKEVSLFSFNVPAPSACPPASPPSSTPFNKHSLDTYSESGSVLSAQEPERPGAQLLLPGLLDKQRVCGWEHRAGARGVGGQALGRASDSGFHHTSRSLSRRRGTQNRFPKQEHVSPACAHLRCTCHSEPLPSVVGEEGSWVCALSTFYLPDPGSEWAPSSPYPPGYWGATCPSVTPVPWTPRASPCLSRCGTSCRGSVLMLRPARGSSWGKTTE